MPQPRRYDIELSEPDHSEEWTNLTLEEAAARMDDLTSVGADVIVSDWKEDCGFCHGTCCNPDNVFSDCPACQGSGKRAEPWEWSHDDLPLSVVMTVAQ